LASVAISSDRTAHATFSVSKAPSRRRPELLGTARPATDGLRASIKNPISVGERCGSVNERSAQTLRDSRSLKGERLEGDALGSDEKFATERRFRRAPAERLFGR